MGWEGLDTIAGWIGVLISVFAVLLTGWFRYRDQSNEDLSRLNEEVSHLRSFKDRLEGASIMERISDLESRQRNTDTALARLEQRLTSIDTLLSQIAGNVQQLLHRRGDQ